MSRPLGISRSIVRRNVKVSWRRRLDGREPITFPVSTSSEAKKVAVP